MIVKRDKKGDRCSTTHLGTLDRPAVALLMDGDLIKEKFCIGCLIIYSTALLDRIELMRVTHESKIDEMIEAHEDEIRERNFQIDDLRDEMRWSDMGDDL